MSSYSFLKRGKDAEREQERMDEESNKSRQMSGSNRFRLQVGETRRITFLDGDLSDEGVLEQVGVTEHQVKKVTGEGRERFMNIPCLGEKEHCPLCESEERRAFVTYFTVMDHKPYKDRNGRVHKHERRLFPAKRDTLKRLQAKAVKLGGLRHQTFTVSRIGDDRSANVGTDFEHLGEADLPALAKKNGLKKADFEPFDYDAMVVGFTASELRAMGYGYGTPIGAKDRKKINPDDDDSWVKGKKSTKDDDEWADMDDVPTKKKKVVEEEAEEPKPKKKKVVVDDEEPDEEPDEEEEDEVVIVKPKKKVKVEEPPFDPDEGTAEVEDEPTPKAKVVKKKVKPLPPPVDDDEPEDEDE